jgi:Uma2 family endonuclease
MTLVSQRKKYSAEQFLDFEITSKYRHEYINGFLRKMAYASHNHETIVANLIRLLGNYLFDKGFTVLGSNRLISIPECDKYYYPDITVVKGKSIFKQYKGKMVATMNPYLIVEILSDTTSEIDKSEKLECYQKVESLQYYLLVSQDAKNIQIYKRTADPKFWLSAIFTDKDEEVEIDEMSLKINQIYHQIEF